jgi:hypothetical protein
MATSIQSCGTSRQTFNDLDLLVITGLVMDYLDRTGHGPLDDVCRDWKRLREEYAPGIIDLALTSVFKDANKREAMISALSAIEQALLEHGPYISAARLNEHFHVRGVRFADYDTSLLLSAARQLKMLLATDMPAAP